MRLADDLLRLTPIIFQSGGIEFDDPKFLVEDDEAIAQNPENRLRSRVAGAQLLLPTNMPGHIMALNGHPEKRPARSPDGLE